MADERSNSVLIAGEQSQRLRVRALIAHLDTPLDAGGDTRVRYLHYADAEKIAPKLKEQITGIVQAVAGAAGVQGPITGGGTSAQAVAERNAMVWADPANNALVITAPPRIMHMVMTIIDKLDIRRPQVLVEAIIAEVDIDKDSELGINWAAFSNGETVPVGSFVSPIGGTSIVDLAGAIQNPASVTTPLLQGTTIGIGRIAGTGVNFAAMIRAIRADTTTNIVATPSTVTMDNQEAELKVAQEVPFITGQFTNTTAVTGGTVNPFQTIQREEVGTILKVTPTISPEGSAVMLKISIESSSIGQKPAGAVDLVTNKRTITTNVLIEDGGVVVLGGLIEDDSTKGENRVPFLGNIPILGLLFKTRNAMATKNNLIMFIRPKILRDQQQAAYETELKYNYMRDEQHGIKTREALPLLPNTPDPNLPPLQPYVAPATPPAAPAERADDATGRRCTARPGGPERYGEAEPGPRPRTAMNDVATHSEVPEEAGRRLSFAFAKRHGVLVNRVVDGVAECSYRDSASPQALAEVRRYLRRQVRLERVPEAEFDQLLRRAYEAGSDAMQAVEGLDDTTDLAHLAQDLPEQADLLDSEDDAPIIRLINAVLTQAVKENASDIHVEPFENRLVVRFRIDGVLREVLQSKRAVAPLVVSRIKVMSRLDIAEKRLPQDGRISLKIAGRAVDVRVSTIPSGHGERVVLRILDKQAGKLDLNSLGMDTRTQSAIDELIHKPHGILLVTGPTGSGKTTTLYAALERLNDNTQNIMTVEDPIEYYIDGIGQTQVNTKVEMTFARGLRAILRQDPDVVLIGEIRDLETAQIAVQASLTGHLVLSTLHTNTAAGAITRLRDMGIEPFLLSSSLIGVLAQRLVRVLSPESKQPFAAGEYERRLLNLGPSDPSPTLYRPGRDPTGGYRGRSGIYELIMVDDAMRTMIHDGVSEQQIERHARLSTPSIRDDGRARVLRGETTLEEILRVTRED